MKRLARGRAVAVLALAFVLSAARAGLALPTTAKVLPVERMRRLIERLVRRLGDRDPKARKLVEERLAALGPRGIPLLVPHLRNPDVDVARRGYPVLVRMAPPPGPVNGGLALSAVPVGPRPQRGEAVTLWLTLTNKGDRAARVFLGSCVLTLTAVDAAPAAPDPLRIDPRRDEPPMPRELAPGETVGLLMDADARVVSGRFVAHLAVAPIPAADLLRPPGGEVPVFFFNRLDLASRPFSITCARKDPGDPVLRRLAAAWLAKEDGAEKALLGHPRAVDALRLGLRCGGAAERRRVFGLVCKNPRRELADDVVDAIARQGLSTGGRWSLGMAIRGFGRVFRPQERLAFFCRVAHARPYDWGLADMLAQDFGSYYDARLLATASRIVRLVPARHLDPGTRGLLAWQLFATPDPDLHDPKRAQELIKACLAEDPDDPHAKFLLAMMQGKRKEARAIAEKADSTSALNSIAWSLATGWRPEATDPELAVRAATRAVGLVDPLRRDLHAIVDTLACAHARAGHYAEAARQMERALEGPRIDRGSRECFGRRLARFLGRAHTPPELRDRTPSGIAGTRARDALLGRLKTATRPHVYDAFVEALRKSFPGDSAVDKAVKTAPRPTEDSEQ